VQKNHLITTAREFAAIAGKVMSHGKSRNKRFSESNSTSGICGKDHKIRTVKRNEEVRGSTPLGSTKPRHHRQKRLRLVSKHDPEKWSPVSRLREA
jgi:hypothetical protein